jgi:GDP-L-fucose synthase
LDSDAAADACVFLVNLPERDFKELTQNEETAPIVNIGCGDDITIVELAKLVANVVGFQGRLVFDTSKPDGTPRKLMDIDRLRKLGWNPPPAESLREGLQRAYRDYLESNAETKRRKVVKV